MAIPYPFRKPLTRENYFTIVTKWEHPRYEQDRSIWLALSTVYLPVRENRCQQSRGWSQHPALWVVPDRSCLRMMLLTRMMQQPRFSKCQADIGKEVAFLPAMAWKYRLKRVSIVASSKHMIDIIVRMAYLLLPPDPIEALRPEYRAGTVQRKTLIVWHRL